MTPDPQPLEIYCFGSDPTNDELPPDGLFGPSDDPTPLQILLYGTKETNI